MAVDWKEQERIVARMLSDWWGHPFRRTPGSGGWAKGGHRASQGFHGDIVAPPEANFPFSVEIKSYKGVELYLALYGLPSLFSFWEQCQEDADRVNKRPMLIMKGNYLDHLLGLSKSDIEPLEVALDKARVPISKLRYYFKGHRKVMFIVHLKSFLKTIPPSLIKH